MPSYRIERKLGGVVAGIDEAGRGPLAGPVVAAAVIIDIDALPR
ncbi:MAG TPA: ribonuclease HII, partial [Alphaproteobacteria bacterium]